MPTSVAIIGAAGAVGSTLAAQILATELLEPQDRLQLVGHGVAESETRLASTRMDLLDAYDDERVDVEVVPDVHDIDADIVVMAASVGGSNFSDRRELGAGNCALFAEIAEICAQRVPKALFIVISNPVELCVDLMCTRLDRKRVVGMGAEQDSLRFGRAIARDLGITRHEVRASVLGEHGGGMVPLWSSVELLTEDEAVHTALKELRQRCAESSLLERVHALQAAVRMALSAGDIGEAYELARRALPDARIFVEPMITLSALHSTPNATAHATLPLLRASITHDGRLIHGQVKLQGEFAGLYGVCGVPLLLARMGWEISPGFNLDEAESSMLTASAKRIDEYIASVKPRSSTTGRGGQVICG